MKVPGTSQIQLSNPESLTANEKNYASFIYCKSQTVQTKYFESPRNFHLELTASKETE